MSAVKDDEHDTTVELEEADDLIDIHFSIVNDEPHNLEALCDQVSNLDGRFLDDLDSQHLNMTPLALAAALNKPHLCKILLAKGASVDCTFANLKTTALMTSSFHGHSEVVRVLLAAGADPRLTDVQESTALGYCFGGSRNEDVVGQLLEAGTDVNVSNVLGMNAFLLVSGYGNPKLLGMVLNSGVKVEGISNNYGHTPLHLAVLGKLSQVNLITQKGVYNSAHYGLNRRNLKETFVDWARNNQNVLGDTEVGEKFEKVGHLMQILGEQFITSRFSPEELLSDEEQLKQKMDAAAALRKKQLLEASSNKKNTIIDSILSCGGKRGKQAKGKAGKERGGGAPLERQETEPQNLPEEQEIHVEDICKNFLASMVQMLQVGCEIEEVEHTFTLTPLDIAILNGDVESAALLLARGANPDHLLSTLALFDLYQCISALRPDKKYIKDVLDHDKHLNVNQSFLSAHIPTRLTEAEVEDMIGDSGLTPMGVAAKCRDNSTTEVIKMLAKHGADINGVGSGGRSPLGEACRWGNVKMVEFLIAQGADMEQPNPAFKMATAVAIATISRQPALVQFLISKGAKIDKEMSDKRTPLISAIDCEDMAMVDKLLQADPVLNCHNKNSLDYQMIRLYQSPNKDIRVILQEISKRATEIKAEEEEDDEAARRRTSKLPEAGLPGLGYPVYDSIQTEEIEPVVSEKPAKVKKKKSKKGVKVDDDLEEEQLEVVEPVIAPQTQKGLEPSKPQEDVPIYAQVNKSKRTSKKHTAEAEVKKTTEHDDEHVKEVVNDQEAKESHHVKHSDNSAEKIPHKNDVSSEEAEKKTNETDEHTNNQFEHGVKQIEEALHKDLLGEHETQEAANEHVKSKKKKTKKKFVEHAVEEAVKEKENVEEHIVEETEVTLVKKKSKRRSRADKSEQKEQQKDENVTTEEVMVEGTVETNGNNEEHVKPKTTKKKKSHKKHEEVLTEEVAV